MLVFNLTQSSLYIVCFVLWKLNVPPKPGDPLRFLDFFFFNYIVRELAERVYSCLAPGLPLCEYCSMIMDTCFLGLCGFEMALDSGNQMSKSR